jgi:outer membrane protein OmpA-like peptidoglycan-associated protein
MLKRKLTGHLIVIVGVVLTLMIGCGAPASRVTVENQMYFVHPSPPRCSCILVVPFSNLTNVKQAGVQSGRIMATRLNASGKMHAFDMPSMLRALNVSMPPEMSVEFVLEVSRVVEADAVLFGRVGGVNAGNLSEQLLWVDGRLLSRNGELLWAHSQLVRAGITDSAEKVQASVKRQVEGMATRLVSELRPQQEIFLGACLHPDVRRAMPSIFGSGQVDKIVGAGTIEAPPPAPPPSVPAEKVPPPVEKAAKEEPKPIEMSEEAQAILEHLSGGKSLVLRGVKFKGRSTEGIELDDPFLLGLGDLLQAQPYLILQVLAHTDASRDAQADLQLTYKQATIVAKRLSERWKVPAARIQPVGMGGKHPVQVNITKRGRQTNRRIEVILVHDAK